MTKTEVVADAMRHKIASHVWPVGQAIPGLFDLAAEFGVSFGTVRAAQQLLVSQGLLTQPEQGVSTSVLRKPPELDPRDALQRLRGAYRSLGEELERLAATPALAADQPAMALNRLTTHQVHDFARFHAAAAALANGCQEVQVSGSRTRLIVDGSTAQVISRRQARSPWQVSVDHPVVDDARTVIFVDLTGREPEFYIAPADWVRNDVKRHHDAWLARKGGVRPRNPQSDHHAIELHRIAQWHQRWDVVSAGRQQSR